VGINERPPKALLDRIEEVFGFTVPRKSRAPHLRSEPWIVAHLARALLGADSKTRFDCKVLC
jgi:hypothetical protein